MIVQNSIEVQNWGLLNYAQSLHQMDIEHKNICSSQIVSEKLILVQHPPVVTMGNRFNPQDMLVNAEHLSHLGIDFCHTDRGGSVTVHEPGQLVVYPLLRIDGRKRTVRNFICALEECMIQTCAHFGVVAKRDSINPGVWVNERKIGAVGIRISQRVSKHGIALNITNTLSTFQNIIPCGIASRGVVNLKQLLSTPISDDILIQQAQEILIQKLIKSL